MTRIWAALIACVLVVGVAPAANAGRAMRHDGLGDAVGDRAADIARIAVIHRRYKVEVRVRVRSYAPTHHVMLDINRRSRFDFKLTWQDEDWDYNWPGRASVSNRAGSIRCFPRVRFRDGTRVLVVVIPRWCVGKPRRVRIRAMTFPNAQGCCGSDWRPHDTTWWTRFAPRG